MATTEKSDYVINDCFWYQPESKSAKGEYQVEALAIKELDL
jgi:hypothetical protein